MCILTDSSPGMACTCPVPSTSAPAMPQEGKRRGGEGETRPDGHSTPSTPGDTRRRSAPAPPAPAPPARRRTPRRPDDLHHRPALSPAPRRTRPAPRSCTGQLPALHESQRHAQRLHLHRMGEGEERERGKERGARQNSPPPCRQSHIYTEPMPTSTCPAPENSQPLPVLLPAQLLCPLSCNSAFGEFAEPRPPEAPIADGEHLPARLLSIQAPGEPLHFQRPGQFYKLTQYLPSLTYPSFFTRQ